MDPVSSFIFSNFCREFGFTSRLMHFYGQGDSRSAEIANITSQITILLIQALRISFLPRNQQNIEELGALYSEYQAMIRQRDAVFIGFAPHQGNPESGDY